MHLYLIALAGGGVMRQQAQPIAKTTDITAIKYSSMAGRCRHLSEQEAKVKVLNSHARPCSLLTLIINWHLLSYCWKTEDYQTVSRAALALPDAQGGWKWYLVMIALPFSPLPRCLSVNEGKWYGSLMTGVNNHPLNKDSVWCQKSPGQFSH